MKHFSQEYLEQLQNEHKLIVASIRALKSAPRKYSESGENVSPLMAQAAYDQSILQLHTQRVMLESKIDVLNDFLNG